MKKRLTSFWIILILVAGGPLVAWIILPEDDNQRLQLVNLLGTRNSGELIKKEVFISKHHLVSGGQLWQPSRYFYLAVLSGIQTNAQDANNEFIRMNKVYTRLGKKQDQVRVVQIGCVKDSAIYNAKCTLQRHLELPSDEVATLLIDYNGRVVLVYDRNVSSQGILTDIKHLIKFAR